MGVFARIMTGLAAEAPGSIQPVRGTYATADTARSIMIFDSSVKSGKFLVTWGMSGESNIDRWFEK
jgi:hypothetical protein